MSYWQVHVKNKYKNFMFRTKIIIDFAEDIMHFMYQRKNMKN